MDKELKKIYRRTGLFVFAAVLILILLLLFIAQEQRTFARKYSFYTVLEDAVGLDKTTSIRFKGTEIGRVRDFTFNEERNVETHFHIYSEYRDLMVRHSAISKSVPPLGGRATLDFLMGPLDGDLAEEHSLIPSLDMPEGRDLLARRKVRTRGDQISSLVANLGTFVENLNRDDNFDQGSVFRMLYHLAFAAENLNNTLENMNSLAEDLQKDNYEAHGALFRLTVNLADLTEEFRVSNSLLAKNLMNLNDMIINYSQPDDLLTRMIDPGGENIMKPLNEGLESLAESMKEINQMTKFLQNQSPEIAILMSETRTTLSELQKTLQGINNNPLIRRGIIREELPGSGERVRPMEAE